MLRKKHVVCLIKEYSSVKRYWWYKLSPSRKKQNAEVRSDHFGARLDNFDQGGVGWEGTVVLNPRRGCPVGKNVPTFLAKIVGSQIVIFFSTIRRRRHF